MLQVCDSGHVIAVMCYNNEDRTWLHYIVSTHCILCIILSIEIPH